MAYEEAEDQQEAGSAASSVPDMSVEDALAMYEQYKTYWNDNYQEAAIDLKMAAGDPATHWGDHYNARRANKKLTMVINELPQFIHQVTNDIRQNTPSINVLPKSDSDVETAEVYSDLTRGIEYESSADAAYDTGAEYAVKCGIGFIRVSHDYVGDDTDEQELCIEMVPDPLSVFNDPASIEVDGRDSNGQVVLEPPISKAEWKRLYPKFDPSSFTAPKDSRNDDNLVIGTIYKRVASGKHGKTFTVYCYKFSGKDLLAKTTFPGKYVPYVPVYGEVVWIEGKRIIASLIRQARDPQLRLNHWACKEQEILNMAPIAPVMAVQGTLVNDRGQWQSPGTETVLEYNLKDADGDPVPPPSRLQPPPIPTGVINAMEGAKQNIKESLGMYNASIGEKSNETSGIAIAKRQHEGDVATFHFPDNVRRSVTQVGRIIVEAIPVVYDTPRIIQTVNEEMEPQMLGINGAPLQPGQKRQFDLTKGKYHVRVTTGASYTTKRQEAADFLSNLFQKDPALMQIGGDLLFKNLDLPGAQALASRFKKTIPPQLLDESDQQQDPRTAQLMQKMQEMQQIIQQGMQEIQGLQKQLDDKNMDYQLKRDELLLKNKDLDIKAREISLKYAPVDDTAQQLLDHALNEKAADNQLERDLLQQVTATAMQPEPAPQQSNIGE